MVKKKPNPLSPIIRMMAEIAVDDAIAWQEKHPGKKRTWLTKEAARKLLDKGAPKIRKPRKRSGDRRPNE